MSREALGKGLKGMLGVASPTAAPVAAALSVPLNQIAASPFQPRQVFDETKLAELAESIGELGLVQPLVVRRLDATHYQLVAGERRLRALTMLGRQNAPVTICNAPEDALRETALVENLQRENLNAIETAEALKELSDHTDLTHEKIAARLGKSRVWITNTLRLLNLPREVCRLIAGDEISGAHGRTLLGLADPVSQLKLAKRVVAEQIPVQKLEKIVQEMTGGKRPKKRDANDGYAAPVAPTGKNRHLLDLEKRLGERLGAQVRILDDRGAGKIEIAYGSYDDIAGILERLGMSE
ncbi:MAG: ParB/RepB/Spo0J family partition protein [Planctomycetota bacterium]|nr:ParB/RepB/Spo0J family partition protein [Planctomycetota bacterium]